MASFSKDKLVLLIYCFSALPITSVYINGSKASIVSLLMILIAFVIANIRFKKFFIIRVILSFLILLVVFSLSLVNGGSFYISLLKTLSTILFILIIESYSPVQKVENVKIVYILYILLSCIVFVFFSFDKLNNEIPRFYGYAFDPNYFALMTLSFYIPLYFNCNFKDKGKVIFLLRLFIFISLSSTGIALLLLFHILIKLKWFLKYFASKYSLMSIFWLFYFSNIIAIFMIMQLIDFHVSSLYLKYKLVSLSHRFDAQIQGLDIINSSYEIFLMGVGSGRTLEMVVRAFHNGYLQMHFAHGFFFLILISLYITWLYHSLSKRIVRNNDRYLIWCAFFVFLFANLFLDSLLSFTIIPMLILMKNNMVTNKVSFENI